MKKNKAQNQRDMRNNNCRLVLDIIRDKQDFFISRADIARITKMGATSVTRITEILISIGLIKEAEVVPSGSVGRKGISLRVVSEVILTVGIAIDSDFINVCILNFYNKIIASKKVTLIKKKYQPEEIIEKAYEIYTTLYDYIPYNQKNIKYVGIAHIGNIDHLTGEVFFAPQFGWTNVELGKLAKKTFGLPVFVDNDLKSILMGLTYRYKNIRYKDMTYLGIGTGVGAAIMYGGELVRGSNNAVGEIGHIILESGDDARQCDCGHVGCIQTYLTKNSFVEQCVEMGKNITDISQIYEAYRKNEKWAKDFIESQSKLLAMLIRNLVYMYNTTDILMGGPILVNFPEIYEMATKKLFSLIHENLYNNLKIQLIDQNYSADEGAALIAQETFLESYLDSRLNM